MGSRRLGLILAFLTLAACLVILEVGVRLDDWRLSRRPKDAPREMALLEENRAGTGSYRLRPNLDLETPVGNMTVRIRTNSRGMHWREVPLQPDPARPRVAFLGDSFTFGSWARDAAHTFVGVFESQVADEGFEALNFGVGGYGLVDEELLLKESVLGFSPSYVIVAVYVGNDFRDTWLGLNRERIIDGTAHLNDDTAKLRVPPENLVEDTTLALDCPAPLWRRVASRSAAFLRLAPLLNLEDLCVKFQPNRNFFMPGFWSKVLPADVAVKATDFLLETVSRMDAMAREHRARLGVVVIPTADQVYAMRPAGRDFDTALPQSAIQAFCSYRRIPYLDLLPALREQAAISNQRLYLKNDIHFTEFGHGRAGEFIAHWFKSQVRR